MKRKRTPVTSSVARRQRIRVDKNLRRDPVTGMYYGFKKIRGRRYRHSLGTTDRVTANGKLKDWLRGLDAADASAPDLKFEALLQNFIAIRASKSASTRASENGFASILRKSFSLGMSVPVRKIKTSDLLKWLTSESNARDWGPRCYNGARFFLRQMFDLAVADGVLTEATNPFRPKHIRPRRLEKTVRRIPTLDQFEEIIESVRAQRDNHLHEQSADFLAFLGLGGVGQAEAASMKWRDIGANKISFVRQKTKRSFQVPIYPWLVPLIQKLREARKRNADDDSPIFTIRDAGKALENACLRLGYPHFTQRNLRAMCIKRLHDAGVPVKRIALWQGHSDGGQLIQQIYTEVFCDTDAAAEAADLDRLINPKIVRFSSAA